jgi:LmbE family N-acetylglucosaminyl deacetylase
VIGLAIPDGPLTVLCLGAHPDDIEIGCGGALLCLAARPEVEVTAFVLTGSDERVEETRAAMDRLVPGSKVDTAGLTDGRLPAEWGQVKQSLEDMASRGRPDLVLAPRSDDAHQDHRLVGRLVSTVWRDALVLHYEIPKWDGDLASPSHYVPLTVDQARRKLEILNDCFPSQRRRDWWDDEYFLGMMRVRGVECRARYAEGFFADKVLLDLAGRSS